jgi:hypothetical protein
MSKKKLIALVLCVACVLSAASPGSFATDDAQDEAQVQAVETVTDVPAAVEYDEPAENPTEDAQPVADSEPAQLDPATEETEPVEEAPAEEPVDPQPTEETDEGTEPAQTPEQEGESTDAQDKDTEPESGAEVDDTQDKTAQEPETSTDKEDAQEPLDNDEEVAEEEETAEDDKATEDDKDDIKSLISKILEKLIGAIKVTVAGELPEDAQLVLGEGSKLKAETLLKQLVGDVNYVGVYSIDVDGADVGNTVEVTLDGLDIPQGKHVYVLHVLDSQEAIQAAIAANVENLLQSNNVLALLAAAKEAFLGGGYVYGITQEATVDGNSISFTTDSFSDFIVYTVDFHYDGYTYSIPGESSILLSELFDAIGFTAYTADYAESVVFSDPDLLAVSQNEDQTDWTLTSLAAFDTDETLTVTFKNGDTLELAVTDASATTTPTLKISVGLQSITGAASHTLSSSDSFTFKLTLTSEGIDVTSLTSSSGTIGSDGTLEFTLNGTETLTITGLSGSANNNTSYTVNYTVEQLSCIDEFVAVTETASGSFGLTVTKNTTNSNRPIFGGSNSTNTTYSYSESSVTETMYNSYIGSVYSADVYVGINCSYYLTDYKYPNGSATGDDANSYHKFPSEPAASVEGWFKRMNDGGSIWQTCGDSPLVNKAPNYIDASILTSGLFKESTIDSTTWGSYDPTGEINRSYLTLKESDYTEIITQWLNYMATTTDYSIYSSLLDDTVWAEQNAEDYKVIPYIIKYLTSSNRWVIDMVIVKRDQVTLSYDLDVKNGYTISNGDVIASKTVNEDSDTNVYLAPTEVYPSFILSKTVGEVTYKAEFQYWEDTDGNKYGSGYATTIHMDTSKTLKAVWYYPDQTTGALRVEKILKNSSGNTVTDDDTVFEMKITTTGTTTDKTYKYTVYNTSNTAKVKSGTIDATNNSIKLKGGQYFVLEGLTAGQKYTVTEVLTTDQNGLYTANRESVDVEIVAGSTKSTSITNTKITTEKLTITKSGMKDGETAVFDVKGVGLDITVSVPNGGSITIDGLTIGQTYTVTEDTSWSWRYQQYSNTVTIAKDGSTLAVENTTENSYWLSGETHAKNVFDKATG